MKKPSLRILSRIAVVIFGPPLLYALAALTLGLIPVNRNFHQSPQGIDIYIHANAVHTDLILPFKNEARDWHSKLPELAQGDYLAIGWGDRAFYLETRHWSDLKAGNALRALTGLDHTLLHVEPLGQPPETAEVVKLRISPAEYARLVSAIDAAFDRGADSKPLVIPGQHYGERDAFYEATGRYSLLTTCNEWARATLDQAGIRTAAWAPFSQALLYQASAAN